MLIYVHHNIMLIYLHLMCIILNAPQTDGSRKKAGSPQVHWQWTQHTRKKREYVHWSSALFPFPHKSPNPVHSSPSQKKQSRWEGWDGKRENPILIRNRSKKVSPLVKLREILLPVLTGPPVSVSPVFVRDFNKFEFGFPTYWSPTFSSLSLDETRW